MSIFPCRQSNICNENWLNEDLWKPHLVLLCFDSFRFSRENYYVLPSGMKYVLRLGACRCWEPNILCFAGDTRKDCQGMWINSCWCRPLTVFFWFDMHAAFIKKKQLHQNTLQTWMDSIPCIRCYLVFSVQTDKINCSDYNVYT